MRQIVAKNLSRPRARSAQPLEGLGATIKQLERLCADNKKAVEALRAVQHGGVGGRGNKATNNVSNFNDDKPQRNTPHGNSAGYAIDRLHRQAPELYEQVCAGEKSANAAEIDENLMRSELKPVEEAEHLQRRQEIWEAMRAEETGRSSPSSGGAGNEGFAESTAQSTGKSKRSTNQATRRARKVCQQARVERFCKKIGGR